MTNEKRLIDANVLRDALYEADAITMKGVAIINQFPTVDAVEVVRCKDCKYACEDHEDAYLCGNSYSGLIGYTRGDDFCSCGERKDND